MRAISCFIREVGIEAVACRARFAFRIRVSMSAIGSVSTFVLLPARLRHSGHGALVRELAQADPAEAEPAIHGARTAALRAARVLAHPEFRLSRLLDDERLLGHELVRPSLSGERHAERAEQRAPVLVRLRRGGDRDVEPADRGHLVVVDLGEDDLLADADRVVAAAVERAGVEPAKVANAG